MNAISKGHLVDTPNIRCSFTLNYITARNEKTLHGLAQTIS